LTLEQFIERFVWEADGKIDSYHLINKPPYKGDCDDFTRTAARITSGSALRDFIDLWTFKNSYHRVVTEKGVTHIVLHRRGMGYIDNIKPQWRADVGYKRKLPFIILPPAVMLKILIGTLVRIWCRIFGEGS